MDYKDEADEDKRYKGKYTKKEFSKDVEQAVVKGVKGAKAKKKGATNPKPEKLDEPKKAKRKYVRGGEYADWKVSDLRRFLNEKKHKYLVKGGFPDGKLPRSRPEMIKLCKKLKRKKW